MPWCCYFYVWPYLLDSGLCHFHIGGIKTQKCWGHLSFTAFVTKWGGYLQELNIFSFISIDLYFSQSSLLAVITWKLLSEEAWGREGVCGVEKIISWILFPENFRKIISWTITWKAIHKKTFVKSKQCLLEFEQKVYLY